MKKQEGRQKTLTINKIFCLVEKFIKNFYLVQKYVVWTTYTTASTSFKTRSRTTFLASVTSNLTSLIKWINQAGVFQVALFLTKFSIETFNIGFFCNELEAYKPSELGLVIFR